jgi:hypothetical protein
MLHKIRVWILLLLGFVALLLAFQNFNFFQPITTKREAQLMPPPNPGSAPNQMNYNLEMSTRYLENSLRGDLVVGENQRLKLQILDRHGQMKLQYYGLTNVMLKYELDKNLMNIQMSQNITERSSLQLDHQPQKNQSHIKIGYSW